MVNLRLIRLLFDQTHELKVEYVSSSMAWAEKEFNRIIEMANWSTEKWCEHFDIQPQVYNKGTNLEHNGFPLNFYNTSKSKIKREIQAKAIKLHRTGLNKYIRQAEEKAMLHYENSIEKLAYRISKKELDQDNLSVTTARIGRNIETTLTDGIKTVRAFTILAWGEIQQPHYRYLIK